MIGLPQSTECKKIIPKKVLCEKNALNSAEKNKLDADIKKVTIVNVISPSNIAVSTGESVKSFCVALINLKQEQYDEKNIVFLTKLIKQNILMILECNGKAKLATYYTKLLSTEWTDIDSLSVQLNGLNLDEIWENILVQVGKIEITEGNTLSEQIQQDEEQQKIQKQIEKLEAQARKENNPRKKFDLVQKARELERRNKENING